MCYSAAELLLLHPGGGKLAGSEEEEGTLQDQLERQGGLHAPDKVCHCQRKFLKWGRGVSVPGAKWSELMFSYFDICLQECAQQRIQGKENSETPMFEFVFIP